MNVVRKLVVVLALLLLLLSPMAAKAGTLYGYVATGTVSVNGQEQTWQVTGVFQEPVGVGPVTPTDCAKAAATGRLSAKGTLVGGVNVSLCTPFVGTSEKRLK